MQLDHPWHAYEGRRVTIALADGSLLRECVLVSAGRRSVNTLWVFTDDGDMFIRRTDVAGIWTMSAPPTGQAA